MSHPVFTIFAAALVAGATAAMDPRPARERAWVAARTWVYCVGAVAGGSWLMYAIHL